MSRIPLSRLLVPILSAFVSACAVEEHPVAFQTVDPALDESGTMSLIAQQNPDRRLSVMQAALAQGIPPKVAEQAMLKFDHFKAKVTKPKYIVIVDMTQHSGRDRFYMLDRESGKVDALPAAHGAGSDPKDTGVAKYFSNVPDSRKTSLGSYLIQEKYFGKYGESMKLDGLENTNNNARDRAIVLHPAPYVREDRTKQGRSWGCPAIPTKWIGRALERLSGGAFMYIYGKSGFSSVTDEEELMRPWRLLPKEQWPNESEDAPMDGE